MKYDDASWHYGGNFPSGLPEICGAIHIGMFISWAINSDLVSEFHKDESPEELAAIKSRKKTGAEFLMTVCNENSPTKT
ncbi:MAG: hypothetical protein AAGB13_14470 [Cyanobacteria bacterium P01_F01_bin.33]